MFQSFASPTTPTDGPKRLDELRGVLKRESLDGYLVPRADMFQGEYVTARDERLAWLTGFTGSAGFCALTHHSAGVFIDGRYHVQVRQQVAPDFTPVHWPQTQLFEWLIKQLPKGGVVGYDAWLHPVEAIRSLQHTLQKTNITLRSTPNLIDQIWQDRPKERVTPFFSQALAYSGESSHEKATRIAQDLEADNVLITQPDSIAWLLNIRGSDVAHNPVPHCFALLERSGAVTLYADLRKTKDIAADLPPSTQLRSFEACGAQLSALSGTLQIDPQTCPYALFTQLSHKTLVEAQDPCAAAKARKNPVELAGAKAAHIRDGVAVVRCLAWLSRQAPQSKLTEIDVVKALEGFRQESGLLQEISFDTICGTGANGAIVHYRVNEDSNQTIQEGDLLLLDSGGQYIDGTTDITRTVAIGTPTSEHKEFYTRVLNGMLALSRARFPKGVTGQRLDTIARLPLWEVGADYAHGTGHGVGSYLCVHEGPQSLSPRGNIALEEGMILSNEPGYYREGAFGIRIENLIYVQSTSQDNMLSFETLTYVPFDRNLINTNLLNSTELEHIDRYHQHTFKTLSPHLEGKDLTWLKAACAPLEAPHKT